MLNPRNTGHIPMCRKFGRSQSSIPNRSNINIESGEERSLTGHTFVEKKTEAAERADGTKKGKAAEVKSDGPHAGRDDTFSQHTRKSVSGMLLQHMTYVAAPN